MLLCSDDRGNEGGKLDKLGHGWLSLLIYIVVLGAAEAFNLRGTL